jgi:hypothetical protein
MEKCCFVPFNIALTFVATNISRSKNIEEQVVLVEIQTW